MEQGTKDNGKTISAMDLEFSYGQMAPNTKEYGRITKPMERVHFNLFRDTSMKEIGSEIKRMVLENMFMIMVLLMKVSGRMISNMVWVLNSGMTIRNTKGNTIKAKNKVKEPILGTMALSILDNGA